MLNAKHMNTWEVLTRNVKNGSVSLLEMEREMERVIKHAILRIPSNLPLANG
jgi:hypothetical protein